MTYEAAAARLQGEAGRAFARKECRPSAGGEECCSHGAARARRAIGYAPLMQAARPAHIVPRQRKKPAADAQDGEHDHLTQAAMFEKIGLDKLEEIHGARAWKASTCSAEALSSRPTASSTLISSRTALSTARASSMGRPTALQRDVLQLRARMFGSKLKMPTGTAL